MLPQKAVCPYCKEELDREGEEKFPMICYNCGSDLPEELGVFTCPNCGRARKELSIGKPALVCVCEYNYITRTGFSHKGIYSY